jgi:hypothetical protein
MALIEIDYGEEKERRILQFYNSNQRQVIVIVERGVKWSERD